MQTLRPTFYPEKHRKKGWPQRFTTSKHHKVSRETKTLKIVFYLTNCAKFDSRLILA
jgi:hypothetical protein